MTTFEFPISQKTHFKRHSRCQTEFTENAYTLFEERIGSNRVAFRTNRRSCEHMHTKFRVYTTCISQCSIWSGLKSLFNRLLSVYLCSSVLVFVFVFAFVFVYAFKWLIKSYQINFKQTKLIDKSPRLVPHKLNNGNA